MLLPGGVFIYYNQTCYFRHFKQQQTRDGRREREREHLLELGFGLPLITKKTLDRAEIVYISKQLYERP